MNSQKPEKISYTLLFWLFWAITIASAYCLFNNLFVSVWWADEPLHFSGGFFVGLFIFTVSYNSLNRNITRAKPPTIFLLGTLAGFAAGLCYEIFEVYVGLTHIPKNLPEDVHDLFFDSLGGFAAAKYFINKYL